MDTEIGVIMIWMMSDNKSLTICLISFLLILSSCVNETTYPLDGPIPQADIVYMPEANPVNQKRKPKSLGFINSDGSNRQIYQFELFGGAVSNVGAKIPHQFVSHPRWSSNGEDIVFSIRDLPPNMRLINENGKMYGGDCVDIYPYGQLTTDAQGYVLASITDEAAVYEQYKSRLTSASSLIARYDLRSCEIISVFSLPLPFGSLISEINEARTGLIAASFHDWDYDERKILLYNIHSEELQTFPGYHPSLTEDGTMLAYYNRDGVLVVKHIRTGENKYLKNVFPNSTETLKDARYVAMPGWSDDNEWVVYNTPEGKIFKININTGENIYLTFGWAPDWR